MRNAQRSLWAASVSAAASLFAVAPTWALQATNPAATAPTAASTLPAGAVAVRATITSVKGTVKVRASEAAPWETATVGMAIEQGAEIRTGLRSSVQFVVGADEFITLDRLGTVSLLEAIQSQGKAKTDIGLKYGRTRYDIREADLQHESTIRSPGSTLAIRGTDVTYEDQAPWVPRAVSREGRAEFRNFRRQTVAFGGKKRASVAADKSSPAAQAIAQTKADPRGEFAGRTESEEELVLTLQPIGGVDAQGLQALQDLARISGFTDTFAGIPPVPGPLEFQFAWLSTASAPGPTNLDLLVTDPQGNTASPTNIVIGSGSATGTHFGDDVGTSGNGAESVVWGLFFPSGNYTITATHKTGDDAQIFVDVLQGQASDTIASFGRDQAITLTPGESFTQTVSASSSTTPQQAANASQRAALRAERQRDRADARAAAAQVRRQQQLAQRGRR